MIKNTVPETEQPAPKRLFRKVRVPLSEVQASALQTGPTDKFSPTLHLAYRPGAAFQRLSLTDIGVSPSSTDNASSAPALCDFAVTAPFPLLSPAGVKAMQEAVMSRDVQANCKILIKSDDGAPLNHWQIRGPAKYSQFIKDLWSSPEVNAAVSDAAQMPLKPTMAYELGHTNVQLPEEHLSAEPPIDSWHYDANCPFVCIVMLSDPADMVGGETAIMKADGSVHKIRYPAAGWAIVLQGMNVKHCGTPVTGGKGERMSMVTSYQAADDNIPYHGTLRGVRIISEVNELYGEWTASRLRVLAAQAAALADKVEKDRKAEQFDLQKTLDACQQLEAYHAHTMRELSPDTEVSDIF